VDEIEPKALLKKHREMIMKCPKAFAA